MISTTHAMRLDFGIPVFGGRVSYRDGVLRIQPPPTLSPSTTTDTTKDGDDGSSTNTSFASSSMFVVPNAAFYPSSNKAAAVMLSKSSEAQGNDSDDDDDDDVLGIQIRMTETKGYGAFAGNNKAIPKATFLGIYEGVLIKSRTELDRIHEQKRKEMINHDFDFVDNVADYVMSLDGGMHFLDGYEFRATAASTATTTATAATATTKTTTATTTTTFTPAHLNHADKDTVECNVIRKLVYVPDELDDEFDDEFDSSDAFNSYPRNLPRVAFFASREIQIKEELCFDYGTNFWKEKKKKKETSNN